MAQQFHAKIQPTLQRLTTKPTQFTGGILGDRVDKNLNNLLRKIDLAHFQKVYSELHDPWYAEPEFAGHFIDASISAWRYTGDAFFLDRAHTLIDSIVRNQRHDGYLGTYREGQEFNPTFSVWNQQFSIMGLLSYYEATGAQHALDAAMKCADYLANAYLTPGGPALLNAINQGIENSCILIEITRLYELTGKPLYLQFAEWIVVQWESSSIRLVSSTEQGMSAISTGGCFKAIEVLICYRGLLSLYRITGNDRYLQAVKKYWSDVNGMQIGPTGNGSIGEMWTYLGNKPLILTNDFHSNENCVAVGWMQLSSELLSLTGESHYADAMERTLYNHLLGSQAVDGSDFSYYQGNAGRKVHSTPTQWYSCCRYRGMRMLAQLGSHAVQQTDEGLTVLLYAQGETAATIKGVDVRLKQSTDYPRSGAVTFDIKPARDTAFTLRLRKPSFSDAIDVRVNGEAIKEPVVESGFIVLERTWRGPGDRVELNMSMPARQTRATIDEVNYAMFHYGPLVLAMDTRHNSTLRVEVDPVDVPAYEASRPTTWTPITQFTVPGWSDNTQRPVTLTDYASAGAIEPKKDRFQTWIPVR